MILDWELRRAMEEVDALTPGSPPITPPIPEPPEPYCYLGVPVDGARVVRIDPIFHGMFLSDGRRVTVEWFKDRLGPR